MCHDPQSGGRHSPHTCSRAGTHHTLVLADGAGLADGEELGVPVEEGELLDVLLLGAEQNIGGGHSPDQQVTGLRVDDVTETQD